MTILAGQYKAYFNVPLHSKYLKHAFKPINKFNSKNVYSLRSRPKKFLKLCQSILNSVKESTLLIAFADIVRHLQAKYWGFFSRAATDMIRALDSHFYCNIFLVI